MRPCSTEWGDPPRMGEPSIGATTMILEQSDVATADPALATMAGLIHAYCETPSDPAVRSQLAFSLMLTGPLIHLGRAWAYSVDEGIWIGPDLAAHRRRLAERPADFDAELSHTYGYPLATT